MDLSMIGLFPLLGAICRMPYMIAAVLLSICACCSCARHLRCRVRDWKCFKRLLRWSGHDGFDDFDLLILVHEAICEHKKEKLKTFIRVIAGVHTVDTEPSSKGIFQQPLHVFIEQGTPRVTIELLEHGSQKLLANLHLDTTRDILQNQNLDKEQMVGMALKGRGVQNPRLKLTMVVSSELDEEKGLLAGSHADGIADDTKVLMQQHLRKAEVQVAPGQGAEQGGTDGRPKSDIQLLKQACAGPLDLFEGFGAMRRIYCGVRGPPDSRGWVLGIWNDKDDYDRRVRGLKEIDLRRIKNVSADPDRGNVFVITYFDHRRDQQKLMLRIVDLNRDVWVQFLHLIIKKAHAAHTQEREPKRKTRS